MPKEHEVGERVRRLRLACGLGQVDFAEGVGISGGSVSKLENGRMTVSGPLLEAIAQVLDCSPSFILSTRQTVPTTRPWLRAYADASKRAIDQQIADCTIATEVIDILCLRMIPDTVPAFQGSLDDDDEIEQFALDVRAAAQLGEGDVVGNCMRAVERLGCLLLPMREELGRHLGLSARANLVPIICVSRPSGDPSRHVPGDRQRFTVAHELGHLALHGGLGPPQTAEEASRVERQAHLFAGAFLAPGDAMLEELQEHGGRVTLQTLARIKEHWGVSIKALVKRFQILGVIDPEHARSLYKQISARGWNKEEPVPVGNEQAIWFNKALDKWAADRVDSKSTATTTAGIGHSYIRRWIDWGPTKAAEGPGSIVELKGRATKALRGKVRAAGTITELSVRRSGPKAAFSNERRSE
jgi:Zn-dependent peptidase ImmA (M78 family)/transcriptional regulator with XRE-family HTH domain